MLRSAIARVPTDAGLHHALGLTLIRLKKLDQVILELHQAAELGPDQARYVYVYAVALHSAGRGGEALNALKDGLAKHPNNRDILMTLITFSRDAGDIVSALDYAERLVRITPDNRDLANFVDDLRRQTKKPEAE